MSKFNTVYDRKIIFPTTLQQIVQYCCNRCGVLLSSVDFPNSGYQITKNPFGNSGNFTYRVIIQYCAMLAGCFARCNADGILELKWYDTQAFETGDYTEIKSFSSLSVSTEDVVITGIRVAASDLESNDETEKGETYLAGAEGYVLSISGNPLVEYGQAKTVASILAERIVGMRFRPMTASCLGNPALEAGDAVLLTDRKGKTYRSFLTNLTYYTGNYESISCDAEPAGRHSADRYSELEQIIADIKKDTRFQLSQYGKYLEQMNSLAVNAMGYYETVEIQDDGGKITYMHDKQTLSESTIVYKKSIDGFFWSNDGGKIWNFGQDRNGNAVMNVIAAIGLHAEWITTGKIQVLDDDGNPLFLVDMDTKQIIISGDHIRIGEKTASEMIEAADKNASDALEEARKAYNINLILSNEYQGIPTDKDGDYTEFPECKTKASVFLGAKDITNNVIFSTSKSTAVTGDWDNTTKTYMVTGLSSDSGWVDITGSYLNGTFVVTKRFTVAKQKQGEVGNTGEAGRVYGFGYSAGVIKQGKDGALTPSCIDFDAFYRNGTSATRTAYAGRFKIEETVDGSTWTTVYTSSVDESSIRHSLYTFLTDDSGNALIDDNGYGIATTRDIAMVRCTLYAAGGTTQMLDDQTIAVIMDADALTHEEIFDLITNNGAIQGLYKEGGQIYINATYVKSGTFVAGGADNKNGRIEVRDNLNKLIGSWDKDGIFVNGGFIQSVGDNNTELRIYGGRLQVFKNGIEAGYIGTNSMENHPTEVGLSFNLEPHGSYMIWSYRDKEDEKTYKAVMTYVKDSTETTWTPDTLNVTKNLDMRNYEIQNAYIKGLRVRDSFSIPNNVQCDIHSSVNLHSWDIENARLKNLEAINGIKTFTGIFNFRDGQSGERLYIQVENGIIINVVQ